MSNQFQNFFSTSFCRRIKTRHKTIEKFMTIITVQERRYAPFLHEYSWFPAFLMDFSSEFRFWIFTLSDCKLRNFLVKTEKSKQTRENILFTFLTQFWPGTTDGGTELPCLAFRTCSWLWEASVVFKGFFMHIFDIQYSYIFIYYAILQYTILYAIRIEIMWLDPCIQIS